MRIAALILFLCLTSGCVSHLFESPAERQDIKQQRPLPPIAPPVQQQQGYLFKMTYPPDFVGCPCYFQISTDMVSFVDYAPWLGSTDRVMTVVISPLPTQLFGRIRGTQTH